MENNFKAYTSCVVKGCSGRITKDIKLYRIPMSDFEAWFHNLQLDIKDMKTNWRVCSRHFQPKDMGSNKLKEGARPTLNLGHGNVIPSMLSNGKRLQVRRCCIFGCKTTSPPSTVFSFPKDPEREQLWIDRCHLTMDPKSKVHKYICDSHFDKKMIGKGRLLPNAIPNTILNCTDCKNCRKKLQLTSLDKNTCENVQPNTIENFADNLQLNSLVIRPCETVVHPTVVNCDDYEKGIDNLQMVPLPISGENSVPINKPCEDQEGDIQMNTSEDSNPSTLENYADSEDNIPLALLPKNNTPNTVENCEGNLQCNDCENYIPYAIKNPADRRDNLQLDSITMSTSDPTTAVNCKDKIKCIDSLQSVSLPIFGEIPFNKESCEDYEDDLARPINNNIANTVGNCEGNLQLNTSENPIPYVIENCENYIHDIQLDPLDMNGCKGCRALSQNMHNYKKDILKEKARSESIEANYARTSMNLQQEIDNLRIEVDLWKARTEEAVLKNMRKSSENPAIAFAFIINPERKERCTSFQTNLLLKLYEISTRAYRYMQKELKFNLPYKTTLYRWRQNSKNISDLT